MKINELRKQILVQAETPTTDGAGGYALAWTTLATVWAKIAPLSGKEVYAAGQQEGRLTHKVTLRWRKDFRLTTDMRLVYDARIFNIRAVINKEERDREATLFVEEGAAV